MIEVLNKLIAPLRTRIANLVSRAVVSLVDDSKKMQLLQLGVLTDESRDDVERFQNYGFTSVPLEGAEAVVVFVGGRRDHGLAIAVEDRRYRLRNLESGEVAVYTDQGDSIVIRRGGTVEVTAATKVVVDSPLVELAGNVQAAVKGTAWAAARATMNSTLSAQLTAAGVALNTAGVDPVLVALAPTAAGGLVTAATALTAAGAAPTTFEAGAANYLSTKVKVG
jgi:phage baseplate assembly protein V